MDERTYTEEEVREIRLRHQQLLNVYRSDYMRAKHQLSYTELELHLLQEKVLAAQRDRDSKVDRQRKAIRKLEEKVADNYKRIKELETLLEGQ